MQKRINEPNTILNIRASKGIQLQYEKPQIESKVFFLTSHRFLKSPDAEEACDYLTEVLGKNPLLLTELDLSHNKLGDLNGQQLSALLMDSHSRLEKIKLVKCLYTM